MPATLGYWGIRGLAEPIRYLLHYVGEEFVNKRYDTSAQEGWQNDKFKLGLDFPNLPYYIEGDLKITQSLAILRHVAKKHGLAGKSKKETARIEMVEQQLLDLRLGLIKTVYSSDYEKIKDDFVKGVPAQLAPLVKFLGDKDFFFGDSVTYVDFMAYDIFDFYWLFIPKLMDDFPTLKAFENRIESLPELQSYLRSSVYKRWPMFGPMAHFGGGGEEPKRE